MSLTRMRRGRGGDQGRGARVYENWRTEKRSRDDDAMLQRSEETQAPLNAAGQSRSLVRRRGLFFERGESRRGG